MLNTGIFRQIGLDSGALTQLGAVVHRFEAEGEYEAVVLRDDEPHGEARFTVGGDSPTQLDLDAATVAIGASGAGCGCGDKGGSPVLGVGGHLLVHVGAGGRYAVIVRRLGERGRDDVRFDTRELGPGDLFATTVLRPGRYRVTNPVTGAEGRLDVAYPEPGARPFRPPDPVRITAGAEFEPREVSVAAGQGQVFELAEPGRIVIELVEPYDRKAERPRVRYRV